MGKLPSMEQGQARFVPRHPIGVVCHRARMKPDRVRAWERRYGVVEPSRSDGNQRLYSDADIDRLVLLRQAVAVGHRIAGIAALSEGELRQLVRADVEESVPRREPAPSKPDETAGVVRDCLFAIQQLDRRLLRTRLERAESRFDGAAFIEGVLGPLVHRVGELWADGGMAPAHEHLATSVIRGIVEGACDHTAELAGASTLLVTTPAGQRHEIGALLVAATAASAGWQVAYLGADLPASDIASAARQIGASVVALSIVYPVDDPELAGELLALRRHLTDDVSVIVGGRAAGSYAAAIGEINANHVSDLGDLRQILIRLQAV